MTDDEMKQLKRRFVEHKNSMRSNHPKPRLDPTGDRIEFKLSWDEWYKVWLESGHLNERGRKSNEYCMCRVDDIGHYEAGNVYIDTNANNVKMANIRKVGSKRSDATKALMSAKGKLKVFTDEHKLNLSKAAIRRHQK